MYETTISDVLGHDQIAKKSFIGVFARDEIPKSINYPACFVMNTQNSNQPGEHWLAVYYNKRGHCYFFDSYAHPPKYYNMQNYIKKTSIKWTYNKKRIQGNSPFCGFHCILFLLFKTRNQEHQFFK